MTDYLELLPEEEDALPDRGSPAALDAAGAAPILLYPDAQEGDGVPAAQRQSPSPVLSGGTLSEPDHLETAQGVASVPAALFAQVDPAAAGTGSLAAPSPALLEQTLRAQRTVVQAAPGGLRWATASARAGRREDSLLPAPAADPRALDRAVRRDSRRYDNGFALY